MNIFEKNLKSFFEFAFSRANSLLCDFVVDVVFYVCLFVYIVVVDDFDYLFVVDIVLVFNVYGMFLKGACAWFVVAFVFER